MYGIAYNLTGFKSDVLRVRIEEIRDGCAFVRTADILDSGTPLVLDESQVRIERESYPLRHNTGLVNFD